MTKTQKVLDRNAVVLRARELRRRPTFSETVLWQVLRRRPHGLKFRRQHPLGWYIVDFYCPTASLVVEIDGESHSMGDRPAHDARRDAWLRARGLRVLRFDAGDVVKDLESVVTAITIACRR